MEIDYEAEMASFEALFPALTVALPLIKTTSSEDESTHLDAFSLDSTKSLIDKYFTTYCRTLSNRRSKTVNESSDSHRV